MKVFLILIAVMLTAFIIVGNFIVWFSQANPDETSRSTVGSLTVIVIYIWVTILTFGGYW